MKRLLSIIAALAMVAALTTGVALAKPGSGHGNSSGGKSSASHGPGNNDRSNYHGRGNRGDVNEGAKGAGTAKMGQAYLKAANNKPVENGAKDKANRKLKQKIAAYKGLAGNNEKVTGKFSDTAGHWAEASIKKMSAIGLFGGYEDGTFQPKKAITQAETIVLINRLLGEEEVTVESGNTLESTEESPGEGTTADSAVETTEENSDEESAPDSAGENMEEELIEVPEWARGAAKYAAQNRIININRFHSRVQATRAEAAVWIAKAMGLEPVETGEESFSDGILLSPEDLGYILALQQEGIIKGMPDGRFNPNSAITRAEMAVIMERIIAAQAGEEEQDVQDETTGEITDEATDEATDETTGETSDESLDEATDETLVETSDENETSGSDETTGTSVTGSDGELTDNEDTVVD